MSEELERQTTVAAVAEAKRSGLLDAMADHYGLSRSVLADTLKKTIFPSGTATNEQLAAFCAVAHLYDLNPFLKEIYAYPAKGGGVVPIVGVDGWYKLINRQAAFDGVEVVEVREAGNLVAFTCTIWRKDRSHPLTITEYVVECRRQTDPWRQQPVRMLRHRAIAQCARIAFGFGGLYDEYDGAMAAGIRAPASPSIERLNRQIAGAPIPALEAAPVEVELAANHQDAAPQSELGQYSSGLELDFDRP